MRLRLLFIIAWVLSLVVGAVYAIVTEDKIGMIFNCKRRAAFSFIGNILVIKGET